jgi:PAS domain S-box-containing protein
MNERPLQVLLVEDNAGDVRLIREMFRNERPGSFELTHLGRMDEAEIHLAKGGTDIVLVDMGLPDEHGLASVRRSLAAAPHVPVIVLTGLEDEALAAEAMKAGAQDYLIKGQIENRALPRALRHAIERHQLDLRWREQQFYTRSLIDSNINALMITDPHGIITDVNQQVSVLTDCTRIELIGTPFRNYFTDPDRADAGIGMALTGSKVTDYELIARTRDGSETEVSFNATTFHDRDGTLQGVIAAARDITKLRRMERKLQENNVALKSAVASAERANLAKSDFLATMSHEIRTPMNGILGMADVLWETPLNAQQMQYLEVIRRAGSDLRMLIDDILDLSKVDAGHLELEHVEFDLEEVVDRAIELTAVKARAKGLVLLSHLTPGLGTCFAGDPSRLRQVLVNLLGNAVKFTERGEIVLTCRNHESGKPGLIEFAVSDTGIGIPADKLETIFDDFTQADASITRKYGGSGLGLGISRRIVAAMGGSLTVTSAPGYGSTFTFAAQFDPAPENPGKVPSVPVDLCGKRVLLIDDNATSSLILHETLQAWGLKCDTCRLPEEALARVVGEMAGEQPYSLVFIDSSGPGKNGFEAAACIKRIAGDLPVVMLTFDAQPGDVTRSTEAGLAGYAVKPVARADLLRLVCDAMERGDGPVALAETKTNREEEEPVKPAHILVAEDSPDNRLLVQVYLKGRPYELTFEQDGKAAVDRFATSGDFDLILMDVRMPVMDGLAATRAIRELERVRGAAPVPILALTAKAGSQDMEKSAAAGCNAHLSKPISKSELLDAIEKYRRQPRLTEMAQLGALQLSQPLGIEMPAGLEDIVPGYLANRRQEFFKMGELLAASDFERLSVLAHNLKGSARGYGFPDLVRLGAALEESADQKDRGASRGQITELGNYLDRVHLIAKP